LKGGKTIMKPISELVKNKSIQRIETRLTNLEVRVRVLELGRDLVSIDYPNDMTAWYCKAYKELGETKFGIICSMARQGRKPKQLFGWLLKQELMK
jgi:hypothetical protein